MPKKAKLVQLGWLPVSGQAGRVATGEKKFSEKALIAQVQKALIAIH
jgi:hypothetical protein